MSDPHPMVLHLQALTLVQQAKKDRHQPQQHQLVGWTMVEARTNPMIIKLVREERRSFEECLDQKTKRQVCADGEA
jgi:hypothetical protein